MAGLGRGIGAGDFEFEGVGTGFEFEFAKELLATGDDFGVVEVEVFDGGGDAVEASGDDAVVRCFGKGGEEFLSTGLGGGEGDRELATGFGAGPPEL